MVAMEMVKKDTISVIIATLEKRIKCFNETWIFYVWATTGKTGLTGLVQGNKKCYNLKKV